MTYLNAIQYVGAARRFGMKLGLDAMRALAARLGQPQARLRFVHLAGTNGKGSTAAFCESCLRAGGHRVGLYTSPHLVTIRERIQVDRVPISETAFAEGMAAVGAAVEGEPTFFEIMTALALWHFAREKVDWVVWETGLGGRLDATNIVTPEVAVITNIGLDHTQYLGTTLAEIAREKAGIIKPGVPVVSGVGEGEAVVAGEAGRIGAPLVEVAREIAAEDRGIVGARQRARLAGRDYSLGLIGAHQVANAACALAALRQLPVTLPAEAIARGLETAAWPGRLEILSEEPLTVLDGAHNGAAMEKLLATWDALLAARGLNGGGAHLLFGSVSDKDITGMARMLAPRFGQVALVRLRNERTADPAALRPFFAGSRCETFDSVAAFLARPGRGPLLITGSLFLVGEILAERAGAQKELELNERLESGPTRP